jgi:NodT family efflux transporter outer membrane factor (OMF) lipoprotein
MIYNYLLLKVLYMKWMCIGRGFFRPVGLLLALLLAAGGCTVGPNYARPELPLPEQWSGVETAGAADAAALQQWWTTFDDPVLASLIERTDAGNLDLLGALARIDQSRALRAYASGETLPAIDAAGSYNRSRSSGNGLGVLPGENSLYSAGFDAFWELDLFGRIRRSVESAQAALEQSVEDYRDVRVSLYAEVARTYIDLRTAQARLHFAQANIEIQRKTLQLTQNRFDAEIAPELDVAQARLNLSNTESEIPSLRIAETAAINRLAVLAGTTPHTLREELIAAAALPQIQGLPTVGLPAELLRRRPDIRSAERALAAQTSRIGLAEAQRYPSFSLSGTLGLQATHFSEMGDWDSRMFAFGPAVRWNLFDGNRLRSLVAVEEARTKQLAAAYESVVLRAVEEVENALVGYAQEQERAAALRRSVEAARQSVTMVETLYRSGLTNFQNVLDSQRSLSLQEDRLAVSEGLILQHAVALYKALGGGWEENSN